jgi:hypothetical protein
MRHLTDAAKQGAGMELLLMTKSTSVVVVAAALALGASCATANEARTRAADNGMQCVVQAYGRELTVVALSGAAKHLPTGVDVYGAVFMPDGRHYIARLQAGLAKISLDAQVAWKAPHLLNAYDIAIAPSAQEIAVVAKNTKANVSGLQLVALDDSATSEISKGGEKPSWSADGARLVYAEGTRLMIYDRQKKTSTAWGEGTDPTWAPDGRIAYRDKKGDFVVRDESKKEPTRLFGGKKILTPVYWSADARHLLFVEEGAGPKGAGLDCLEPKQVMLYDVNTKERRSLYGLCKSAPYSFVWATGDVCSVRSGPGEKK